MTMRLQLTAILILPIIIVACSGKTDMDKEKTAVKKMVTELSRDFENADIRSFVNKGTEDMRFFSLNGKYLNKEQTYQFLQPMFDNWQNRHLTVDSLEIFVDRRIAWARYKSVFSFVSRFGATNMKNLNTVIFRKNSSGEWKLQHFHMSTE